MYHNAKFKFSLIPGPNITRCQCSDDVWPKDGVERHPDPPAANGSREPWRTERQSHLRPGQVTTILRTAQ